MMTYQPQRAVLTRSCLRGCCRYPRKAPCNGRSVVPEPGPIGGVPIQLLRSRIRREAIRIGRDSREERVTGRRRVTTYVRVAKRAHEYREFFGDRCAGDQHGS